MENRKKKRRRKGAVALFLILFLTLSPCLSFLQGDMQAQAASFTIKIKGTRSMLRDVVFDFFGERIGSGIYYWIKNDGSPMFCVQQHVRLGLDLNGAEASEEFGEGVHFTPSQYELVSLVLQCCGMRRGEAGDLAAGDYLAAQAAIWGILSPNWLGTEQLKQEMAELYRHVRSWGGISSLDLTRQADEMIETICQTIEEHYGDDSRYIPSFASKYREQAPVWQAQWQEDGTCQVIFEREDKAESIKDFVFQLPDGWTYRWEEDQIIFACEDPQNGMIEVTGTAPEGSLLSGEAMPIGLLYIVWPEDHPDYQHLTSGVDVTVPLHCYFKIYTPPRPDELGGWYLPGGELYRHQEDFSALYGIALEKTDGDTGGPLEGVEFQVLESFDARQLEGTILDKGQLETWDGWKARCEKQLTGSGGRLEHWDKKTYHFERTYCGGHPDPEILYEGSAERVREQLEREAWEAWEIAVEACAELCDYHAVDGSAYRQLEEERDLAYGQFTDLAYGYTFEETRPLEGYQPCKTGGADREQGPRQIACVSVQAGGRYWELPETKGAETAASKAESPEAPEIEASEAETPEASEIEAYEAERPAGPKIEGPGIEGYADEEADIDVAGLGRQLGRSIKAVDLVMAAVVGAVGEKEDGALADRPDGREGGAMSVLPAGQDGEEASDRAIGQKDSSDVAGVQEDDDSLDQLKGQADKTPLEGDSGQEEGAVPDGGEEPTGAVSSDLGKEPTGAAPSDGGEEPTGAVPSDGGEEPTGAVPSDGGEEPTGAVSSDGEESPPGAAPPEKEEGLTGGLPPDKTWNPAGVVPSAKEEGAIGGLLPDETEKPEDRVPSEMDGDLEDMGEEVFPTGGIFATRSDAVLAETAELDEVKEAKKDILAGKPQRSVQGSPVWLTSLIKPMEQADIQFSPSYLFPVQNHRDDPPKESEPEETQPAPPPPDPPSRSRRTEDPPPEPAGPVPDPPVPRIGWIEAAYVPPSSLMIGEGDTPRAGRWKDGDAKGGIPETGDRGIGPTGLMLIMTGAALMIAGLWRKKKQMLLCLLLPPIISAAAVTKVRAEEPEETGPELVLYLPIEEDSTPQERYVDEWGQAYRLYFFRPVEEEIPEEERHMEETRIYSGLESIEEIPETLVVEQPDEEGDRVGTGQLGQTENNAIESYWVDGLQIPVIFHGYDADQFDVQGTIVAKEEALDYLLQEQEAFLSSLGCEPGRYEISEIVWDGEVYIDQGGDLCRRAWATGRKQLTDYQVRYEGTILYPAVTEKKWEARYQPAPPQVQDPEPEEESEPDPETLGVPEEPVPEAIAAGTGPEEPGSLWKAVWTFAAYTVSVAVLFPVLFFLAAVWKKRRDRSDKSAR